MDRVQIVAGALNEAVQNAGGLEAALAQCSAIYDGVYRYPAQKASELVLDCGVSLREITEDIHSRLVRADFNAKYGPIDTFDMEDDEVLQLDYALEDFADSTGISLTPITGDTMVSCLCNYKGEDAGGFALDTETIPIFLGKYNYL